MSASPYGQAWVAGDVIGAAIDMDAGRISYYRNGVDMVGCARGRRRYRCSGSGEGRRVGRSVDVLPFTPAGRTLQCGAAAVAWPSLI